MKNFIFIVGVSLLGLYYLKYVKPKLNPPPTKIQAKIETKKQKDFIKSKVARIADATKCTGDKKVEDLCLAFPGLSHPSYGVIVSGDKFHLLVDGRSYFSKARAELSQTTNSTEVINLGIGYYFAEAKDIQLDQFDDSDKFSFFFHDSVTGKDALIASLSLRHSRLRKLQSSAVDKMSKEELSSFFSLIGIMVMKPQEKKTKSSVN